MTRKWPAAWALVAMVAVLGTAMSAQRPGTPHVETLRLYIIDLGGRPPEAGESVFPAYLVVHPSGRTLLYDSGGLPDAYVDGTRPRDAFREGLRTVVQKQTLNAELAEIGYAPEQITYFALSHYHDDHTGNANAFAGSTWLVQRAERDAMFGGPPPPVAMPMTYEALAHSKTIVVENRDYDVFGDGSAVLKFTPGHTPGAQALFLKLARTGPVVLSGDLYHNAGEHVAPFDKVPAVDTDKAATVRSRVALEAFLKETGAQLWIHHDVPSFRAKRTSPAYYE